MALCKYVFDRPHAFLFGDVGTGRLYKDFHELIIKDALSESVDAEAEGGKAEGGKAKGAQAKGQGAQAKGRD